MCTVTIEVITEVSNIFFSSWEILSSVWRDKNNDLILHKRCNIIFIFRSVHVFWPCTVYVTNNATHLSSKKTLFVRSSVKFFGWFDDAKKRRKRRKPIFPSRFSIISSYLMRRQVHVYVHSYKYGLSASRAVVDTCRLEERWRENSPRKTIGGRNQNVPVNILLLLLLFYRIPRDTMTRSFWFSPPACTARVS